MPDASKLLAHLASLPPAEAVAYMQARGQLTPTFSWMDLWQEEHATQFTVSRLARTDLLQAVHDGVTASVKGDMGRRDFMRGIKDILVTEGWWGEKQVLDPKTGELLTTKFDSARLKLIYDTNTRMAYSAGLWQRIERNKATSPYIRYITKKDERVRASHRAWNNLTLPVDDPFWDTHFPPNGWRCRCRAMSMSQADYDQGVSPTGEKLNKTAPEVDLVEWKNKRTGKTGMIPRGVDPAFAYNPGKAAQRAANLEQLKADKLAALAEPMRKAAEKDFQTIEREGMFARQVPDYPDWVKEARNRVKKTGEGDYGLSDAELVALHLFTHDRTFFHYLYVNRSLRGLGGEAELARLTPTIDTLKAALSRIPAYTGTVYRGTNWMPDEAIAKYVAGETVQLSEFVSAGEKKGFRGIYQFEIQSRTGRRISFASNKPREQEVLMPSGLSYRVTAVETRGKVTLIKMEEL